MTNETPVFLSPTVRLQGEYKLVLNAGTDREVSTGWMKNIVTDLGLDMLGSSSFGLGAGQSPINWLSVGTGTTTPVAGDTALAAYLADISSPTTVSQTNAGSPTYVASMVLSWQFAQGAVVGNLTEVGVGRSSGGTNLFSRARIVDNTGSPTTLTVVSLDQLTVFWKLNITPDLTDLVSSVVISGVTYNYTCRISSIADFMSPNIRYMFSVSPRWPGTGTVEQFYAAPSTIGALTGQPSGSVVPSSSHDSESFGTYTLGNHYNDVTLTFGPTKANPSGGGGIQGMTLHFGNSHGTWQWVFTTPIPKTNTKTLTLTVRFAWGR